MLESPSVLQYERGARGNTKSRGLVLDRAISLLGLIIFFAIAWALSSDRSRIDRRIVIWGIGLQLILALLILGIPALEISGPLRFIFDFANQAVSAILNYTEQGSRFIFGDLVDVEKNGFIFAFRVLPTIIFMGALMAVLYHLRIMQKLVWLIAILMQKTMGTSGAESLAAAANVFVGQTEAPLVIRPFLKNMTRSELMAVMVAGMATVAGGVLAAYTDLLQSRLPDIAGHLLTASFMSAPAALAIAKLMIPETEKPETLGAIPDSNGHQVYTNTVEAAAIGAGDGLKLALNVGAMLLAFIALIALINGMLGLFGQWIQFASWGQAIVPETLLKDGTAVLSFELILGYFFAPVAWIMGIPWSDCILAGSLLGEKIVLNEFVAYLHMSQLGESLSDRSVVILSYALCGFANFSSIAIQIAGIGSLEPGRTKDLAELGMKSVIGGSLAAFSTATIAGILI